MTSPRPYGYVYGTLVQRFPSQGTFPKWRLRCGFLPLNANNLREFVHVSSLLETEPHNHKMNRSSSYKGASKLYSSAMDFFWERSVPSNLADTLRGKI